MRNDFDIAVVKNVFLDNEYYKLSANVGTGAGLPEVGAALLEFDTHSIEGDYVYFYSMAIFELLSRISSKIGDVDVWLLLKAGPFDDSRIARYKKLWRFLDGSNRNIPCGERSDEYLVESEGKISFFGAIKLKSADLRNVGRFVGRGEYGCLAVCDRLSLEVFDVLRNGWVGGAHQLYGYPPELIHAAALGSIFFIRPIGAFDDREWGAVVIARRKMIENVFK